MKKVAIYGTGSTGKNVYNEIKDNVQIIGFLDNDKSKWGQELEDINILGDASILNKLDYDEIVIASLSGLDVIEEQLLSVGVPKNKINTQIINVQVKARINFIKDYVKLYDFDPNEYSVAEGGVFQGEFAKIINECFPKFKLYLFDTFEGFDGRDIKYEIKQGYSEQKEKHLNITSEELVLNKLLHKEKAIFRKGYFPETSKGLEDEKFCFVNLDFDLYIPILEGLRYFYKRMAPKGILLVHDYYNPGYKGVKEAIDKFEEDENIELMKLPIGDHCSIAIVKI